MAANNLPPWRFRIVGINVINNDRAAVLIEDYHGRRIAISISSNHTIYDANVGRLLRLINTTAIDESGASYDPSRICERISEAGGCLLDPAGYGVVLDMNVHAILYQETVHFAYRADCSFHNTPYLAPIHRDEANVLLHHPDSDKFLDFEIIDDLPVLASTDVQVLEVQVHGISFEGRVRVRDQEMLCLAEPIGLHDAYLRRHLETMQIIEKGRRHNPALARIPKLLGYVAHAESGHIIGLLTEWVPVGLAAAPGEESFAFYANRFRDASLERREKWMAQMRETVRGLHREGLVWGDGELAKVFVDTEDNARLTSFGGGGDGFPRTAAGDFEALKNIAILLDMEEEEGGDLDMVDGMVDGDPDMVEIKVEAESSED
ncbi:hypothetical protein PG991_000042 [Apiospora marii]|uniref:Protein kinase domain-containing protein n=1 Tax=Apiospora marii TaxID=335849 RepID=A0ABR1T0Z7_9PEZI